MEFDTPATRNTYSDRDVDSSWQAWCGEHISPVDKDVVDIGCGGGIYTFGFAALGARSVIGVDQSNQYIEQAQRSVQESSQVFFRVGTATQTGLPPANADIVFERALIHHLSPTEKLANATEAKRLLRTDGKVYVQDRTFENVEAALPDFWIRSALFDMFPRLLDYEKARRPPESQYSEVLEQAGFSEISTILYPEIRKRYADFAQLEAEIMARKGKSILFELDDAELRSYCDLLKSNSADHPLVECDLWTVWVAVA